MKNAIVVMFDSLQWNYLGCYGNSQVKTPNMDRLAREGVLFENSFTEGLPTVPCRRAMHTGRYTLPRAGWVPLSMEDTMISDLCWGRPIDTALIFDCPMYRQPKFGYTRGFDKVWFTHGHEMDHYYYEKDELLHDSVDRHFAPELLEKAAAQMGQAAVDAQVDELRSYLKEAQYWKTPEDRFVARTMKKAVEYLEQVDRNKQFFLWIDSFDPHEPWNPPSVYRNEPCPYDTDYTGPSNFIPFAGMVEGMYDERELHHIRMLYAELVTLCDTFFGMLLDALHRLGLEENTLLMMVSDHGDPLGNGGDGHGIMRKCRPWPYHEVARTPMLVRGPGLPAGKRVKAFVQSVDVAPTVCDWLGIGVHPDMQGKSLLPLMRGDVEKLRDFAISGYYKAGWAIYTDEWSYIHWPLAEKDTMAWHDDFAKNLGATSASLGGDRGTEWGDRLGKPVMEVQPESDALARHRAAATLDGEAQWTCTPSSSYETPEQDELYDLRTDPLQTCNVIAEHPDVARKLLLQLQDYMADIR